MRTKIRSVAIRKLPERISGAQRDEVYKDLETCINVDRPAVVLDCSTLRVFDRSAVHLLLCCLEEAMKRNGDVRLAALRPEARSLLHSTGVESLFQCFETISEAVESYHTPHFELVPLGRAVDGDQQSEMSAA
jgi:anti-anti-sigma factor